MNRLAALTVVAFCLTGFANGWQPPRQDIPPTLRPWVDWVLKGHEEKLCPILSGQDTRSCAWPGRLDLDLNESGGSFGQRWRMETEGFAPLPGDARAWPQDLRIDGRPAAAILRGGVPSVRLTPGEHGVVGSFLWDRLPESLAVPAETGLVSLRIRGREAPFPNRNEAGRLWLRDGDAERELEDALEITVQRRVIDSVPLLLVTRMELAVSGRNRELELARVLPDGFVPLSLESPLPARLEPNGRLRIQARAGRWTMTLTGRGEGPIEGLQPPPADGPWANEEVWVFDARPDLRVVEVSGVASVDPRQSTLPASWRALPAYLVRPGDRMTLTQRRRGDEEPTPDRLTLHRNLWLDFDGGGYSVQDILRGTLSESWRLEMGPPSSLERVAVGGVDQVITRREGVEASGVELRLGRLLLAAESRVAGGFSAVPAVGWDHDFDSVSGVLHLPPGWRMLTAFGVDRAAGTWMDRWTLLDFFLVLILALALRRLFGNFWGGLGLATLILIYHEAGAPTWVFFPVLAGEALRRALRPGRARRLASLGLWAGLALLTLQTVPFLVRQVRVGFYPVLERSQALGDVSVFGEDPTNTASIEGRSESSVDFLGTKPAEKVAVVTEPTQAFPETSPPPVARASRLNLQQLDPTLSVNTGSGLPRWNWNWVELSWSGPVEAGQRMRFLLLPPFVNLLLALLRVALLVALVLRVLLRPDGQWPSAPRTSAPVAALVLTLVTVGLASPPLAAQVPPQEILDALRERLLEKPECHPDCAEISRMVLETTPSSLRGRLEVGVAAEAAFPLPGGPGQWTPRQVLLDGRPALTLRALDGGLWVLAAPGRRQVQFEGPLPNRDAILLALPMQPRRVEVRGAGWRVEGLHEDGLAESSLQLIRLRTAVPDAGEARPAEALPPFLQVERTLSFGLQWQVVTRVLRLSPPGVPVSAAIPLIPEEAVTSPETRVEDGRVLVSLASQATEATWTSRLPTRPEISLRAAETLDWAEVWRLDAGPLWHVVGQGVPPVHPLRTPQVRVPEWRPWPGETLTLTIERPPGVEGRSLTFDGSRLRLRPGIRSTDASLELALRSSRGGQHTLTLPDGAELKSVTIDGQSLPIRQDDRLVRFPVDPGSRRVRLDWREDRGVGLWFSNAEVNPGAPGVNSVAEFNFPSNRWILAAGGGGAGPVVLFWSLLVVIVLVAVGLGRLGWTPLKTSDWVLLGIGLSQIPWVAAALVAAWLAALGLRRGRGARIGGWIRFNLAQIGLAFWTLLALALLFWAVAQGLLGPPEMQIAGNGSSAGNLRWFSDRWDGALPHSWVFSLPLYVYRLAMLAWALWLASSLLGWLRWGWESWTAGGGWRPRPSSEPAAGPGGGDD